MMTLTAETAQEEGGDVGLYWEDDCACDLCERDRQRARLLGRGRTSDGAAPVPARAPWWTQGTTEAVVVLTIARQDAAQVVARVVAALNGGDQ